MTSTLTFTTDLAAPADAVWARAITPEGINDELRPIVQMTVPPGGLQLDPRALTLPARLGRSWLLLGGIVPVDYDDLVVEELSDGHFRERSQMATLRPWIHERTVTSLDVGCRVTDRLTFALRPPLHRVPGSLLLVELIVAALFRHRHRRLVRHWGAAGPAA